jgi:hypothetical protein
MTEMEIVWFGMGCAVGALLYMLYTDLMRGTPHDDKYGKY